MSTISRGIVVCQEICLKKSTRTDAHLDVSHCRKVNQN